MRSDQELIRRCRSFALQTDGAWTAEARARLDRQIKARGLTGPVDAVLAEAAAARAEDALYVCVGSSCSKRPLQRSTGGLPIRETACLGACRHAPSAHRVVDGTGQTYAALDDARLSRLAAGESAPDLKRWEWHIGERFPEPALAPLDVLLGAWSGPGGFSKPGCTRSLTVGFVLGGRFLDIDFRNAWPTVAGGDDIYEERLSLQVSEGRLQGVLLDYRGGQKRIEATWRGGVLAITSDGDTTRRRVLAFTERGLAERHQRRQDGAWVTGFSADLRRA